jgi:alpha-glucosidase
LEKKYKEMFRYQIELPEVQDLMKELRLLVDSYPDRVLVGETDDIRYYGSGDDELHLVFNFPMIQTLKLTPAHIRANQKLRLDSLPPQAWPCNTLGNHDSPRLKTRFGDAAHDDELARIWLALILTLRGTPFLYNGEEIGMTNLLLDGLEQVRDNLALYYFEMAVRLGMPQGDALKLALLNSRDQCRTPMQWSALPNAGFSPAGVQTWLPVNPNYKTGINVADQQNDPRSMLNFYRAFLRLRKTTPALIDGDYTPLHEEAQETLAFLRKSASTDQTCLVVLNPSDQAHILLFELKPSNGRCLYSTDGRHGRIEPLEHLQIPAFGIYIAELTPAG